MRRIIIELIACLITISCAEGVSFAQTTASVTVSFNIPVMPGLNAPLIEKEEKRIEEEEIKAEPQKQSEDKEAVPMQETALQEPQLIQQDAQDGKVLVKTFYSR
jgi:hypothetical protein